MKPYYSDKWVTIYHLISLPMCDNISIGKCMEVGSCQRKQLGDTGQGNKGEMFRSYQQEHQGVTNKLRDMCKSVSGLVLTITLSRARILLSSLDVLGHYAVTLSSLAKGAVARRRRDITKMAMLETIAQRISAFYAEDVICLKMVD